MFVGMNHRLALLAFAAIVLSKGLGMSDAVVSQAVKQAIVQAQGDPMGAVGLLMVAAARDNELLRALVKPHLHHILTEHVEAEIARVHARKAARTGGASAAPTSTPAPTPAATTPAASAPARAAKSAPAPKAAPSADAAPRPQQPAQSAAAKAQAAVRKAEAPPKDGPKSVREALAEAAPGRALAGAGAAVRAAAKKPTRANSRTALDDLVDQLADRFPTAAAGGRGDGPMSAQEVLATLGRDPDGPPPSKASNRHRGAVSLLAQSFKNK